MGAAAGRAARDRVVTVLLIIAGVLLLTHLENGVLWQDEAETALPSHLRDGSWEQP